MDHDNVNHPSHYTQYNGIEIIDLTEQMNFNKGNAVKYITRAGFKPDADEIEDLRKAIWYLTREIQRVANFAAENLTTKLNGIEQQYFVGVNPDKVKYRHSVICPCGVMSQESSSIPDACDAHRPLGPDGKHGDRHTKTCGCDETPLAL
jgi:predicted unusual protein kinase regulating ubiquinone biosynthesis (AarF/ABC1/UbiB family)